MGPRGVIGIMTPGPNVNVENEMMNMRPEGVINAIDRYYVPNQKISANADWELIMRHVVANLEDSVRRLNECLIDHLILGMSSQSYMGGEKGSFALLEQLQKLSGVDVTMGAQSAEQAFKLCGAKRIALLTPYYPVIEQNAIDYFTARGFEIVHVEGLKCKSIIHVRLTDLCGSAGRDDALRRVQAGRDHPAGDQPALLLRGGGCRALAENSRCSLRARSSTGRPCARWGFRTRFAGLVPSWSTTDTTKATRRGEGSPAADHR